MVGRKDASKDGYITWLTDLADWFEEYVENEGAEKLERRKKKAAEMREKNKPGAKKEEEKK